MGGKHYDKPIQLFQADEIFSTLEDIYLFTKGYTGGMTVKSITLNKHNIPKITYHLAEGRFLDFKKSTNPNIVCSGKDITEPLSLFVDKLLIGEYIVGETIVDFHGKEPLSKELINDIYNVYNFGITKLVETDEDSFDECTLLLKRMYAPADGFNVIPDMGNNRINIFTSGSSPVGVDTMVVGDVLFSEIDGTIKLCKKVDNYEHLYKTKDYAERMVKTYRNFGKEMEKLIKEII